MMALSLNNTPLLHVIKAETVAVGRVGHLFHVSLHWLLLVVRAREPTGCCCMQRSPPSVLGRPIVHSIVCVGASGRVDGIVSGRSERG
jgi:hypothetical protein